ncbi:hypothetical protein A8B82_19155 [Sulfitobacter sp. EhC04]|uniref:hypothetical protein n=1 Tax=Sulfitobacter sp. EhC04 TaxID=1849168 RepID=UPI0007F4DC3D|nr:hypothetical protein [Sulfitobacter sp. EhC04]OAN73634.1 hypothetical protein A8B82_19155 [Sulfitobacter sp. EhC04]
MTTTIAALIAALAVWMLACGYQGYRARLAGFLGVLILGMALNMLWMALHLNATPLEGNALMAQAALMLYGLCAFGFGWLAGRVVRQFRASRVDDQTV